MYSTNKPSGRGFDKEGEWLGQTDNFQPDDIVLSDILKRLKRRITA
jgi:hypothetical protein